MPELIALVVADTARSRLGFPSRLDHVLAGRSVLTHTIDRLQRVAKVERIVLVHPEGQSPDELLTQRPAAWRKPIACFAHPGVAGDMFSPMRVAGRKWALTAWRGGLGGNGCYDELLPARPLLEALQTHDAPAGLLVGGDWALLDPELCNALCTRHLEAPEAMQFVFNTAPPGLSGAIVGQQLLTQLADNPMTGFASVLGYQPSRPQADPIGKDVCVQIPAAVRSCCQRFIVDTPRTWAMLERMSAQLDLSAASAEALCAAAVTCADPTIPQQVTLELTTERLVDCIFTPNQPRLPALSLAAAQQRIAQLAAQSLGDLVLTLGGRGDALLHPHWRQLVQTAHDAGVYGICLETDLLGEPNELDELLRAPLDVLSVRMNADTNATYEAVMRPRLPEAFKRLVSNFQWLLNERNRRWQMREEYPQAVAGVPWLVPRLIKSRETLKDMETFFDRWMHFAGHAVIERNPLEQTAPGVVWPAVHVAPRQVIELQTSEAAA